MTVETISLAVKCTREEYMEFYAHYRKTSRWSTVLGAILLLTALPLYAVDTEVMSLAPLCSLIAVVMLLMNPLILPFIRKGAAGRRYDNSDALKGALTMTLERKTLSVRTACHEGCVPLSALTEIRRTETVTALVFGKELTVCIPMRAMNEDETAAFETILAAYTKETL